MNTKLVTSCSSPLRAYNNIVIVFSAVVTLLTAVAAPAQLFIPNAGNNTVGEYDLNGTAINASLITGLNYPEGVAVSGGFIYVTNVGSKHAAGAGHIGKYTMSGATVNASLISGLNNCADVVVSGGNLFVSDSGNNRIGKYTTSGETVNAALITGLNFPAGLALSGTNLFVAEADGQRVGEYTTAGATINAALITGLSNEPQSVAVAGSHVFVSTLNDGTVGKYNLDGSVVNASFLADFNSPVVATTGTILFVADYSADSVGKFTTDGATINRTLITGLHTPFLPTIAPGKLLNISARVNVQTEANVAIGGFIVTGNEPKKVIIRGIGPSIAQGVSNALQNPMIELYDDSGKIIARNDDWEVTQVGGVIESDQKSAIQSTGIPPTSEKESALIATLPGNGASYTVVLSGVGTTTGVGLIEVYDISSTGNSYLANISTRGVVGTGTDVLIGGIIVGGGDSNVVVRAIGPSLKNAGVPDALLDPQLELHDGNGALIASNDNWKDTQAASVVASGIEPTADAESVIVTKLTAGAYTAVVHGKNQGAGVALVEVYDLQ